RLIPLGAVCFLLLANTIAWWANPGNGVQKIVRRMREIYPIHCIAGYWQGFNYELRHDVECAEREGRPIQIVDLMYRDRERALAIMRDQIRSHEPFWFVINDNKNRDGKVPLGKVIKYPGPDFEIMRYESGKQKGREIKLELNDAEAVMMRRVTEWAAEGEIQASPSATTVHSE
ncbi:hypothetical protein JXA32_11045, partial [Candidatus Sumerlaeota bacterium]|nr:hypothetical protein [Candidatus Sumerlaeota bacterium]